MAALAKATVNEAARPRPQDTDRYVGARMRERRLALGMTQQQMAELIGVTHQQLHKYEKGTHSERQVAHAYLGGERPGGKRGRDAAGKTPIVARSRPRPSEGRGAAAERAQGLPPEGGGAAGRAGLPAGSNISARPACCPAVQKAAVPCRWRPVPQAGRDCARSGGSIVAWTTSKQPCRTYHHVSAKHAQSDLTSFAYRSTAAQLTHVECPLGPSHTAAKPDCGRSSLYHCSGAWCRG